MTDLVESLWYGNTFFPKLLWPLAYCFKKVSQLRRFYLQSFRQIQHPVPIIVVGNLTVGGVGKTPLVIALASALKERGFRVGIVSRGYGAAIKNFPHEVQLGDSAHLVGDEPLLLARKTACPVVISPNRNAAVTYLLDVHQSQIILSDDGLQHYRMGRAMEIALIDGLRGLGNGMCLPAGPLREEQSRLKEVDLVLCSGGKWPGSYVMNLKPSAIRHLATGVSCELHAFKNQPLVAVAAIGNPNRFFQSLNQLGLQYERYSYPDHYQFTPNDLNYQGFKVIMTEKDAVKCTAFAMDNLYYLPVDAVLSKAFWDAFWSHPSLRLLLCSSD